MEATTEVRKFRPLYLANKYVFSLMESKLDQSGIAVVMFYFVSLDKPEFTQFANELTMKCDLTHCFSMLGQLIYGKELIYDKECLKVIEFIREYCKRNCWNLKKWLEIQMKVLKNFPWKNLPHIFKTSIKVKNSKMCSSQNRIQSKQNQTTVHNNDNFTITLTSLHHSCSIIELL